MPVLPIYRSVGSTLNSTDTRKQLLSCGRFSYQMISEAIYPAPWHLPGSQALCDAHSKNLHCREDMVILSPQSGRKVAGTAHFYQRENGISKKKVLRSRAKVFIDGLRVAGFPFENCTPLWKLPLPPPSFMNLRKKYPEEQCPLMTFLPKRILNWLEELKVMTSHFGIRVIELKSRNSKLSPTNPFFRSLFQWIASVTWRSSGTGRTQP